MKLFFHKTIKIKENDSKSTSHFSSCIKKCKKWNRTLACIFGLLAFFTLMGIGIYTIFGHNTCTDFKPNEEACCDDIVEDNPRKALASNVDRIKCTVGVYESCDVICRSIKKKESLVEHINAALLVIEPPCSRIYLEIISTTFPVAQLSNDWLKNIKPNVTGLNIQISTLTEINENAFDGHPFKENLKVLVIEETRITMLRKKSFLGLKSVNTFHFEVYNKIKLEIEEEALTGMDNLISLTVKMFILTSKDIINLIGDKGVPLRQLQYLSLMYNFIAELPENSFTSIKESVRDINLNENGIETIHKKAFSEMKNIEILTLENNKLKTLEDGTFDLLSNLKPQGITLSGNRWNCSCSLQWLKYNLINTDAINTMNPPLCNNRIEFEVFEFCPAGPTTKSLSSSSSTPTSTTSTSSTNSSDPETTYSSSYSPQTGNTPISTTSTTSKTDTIPGCTEIRKKLGIEILQCKNEISYPKYKNASNDETHLVEIIVEDHKVTLYLIELEGDPLKLVVVIAESKEILKSYYLVWASSENKTKYGCETPLEDGLILLLERDTTYAFSILYQCESETSPKCIFGVKTLPEWAFRIWISNKYQAVVIGITVLVAICVIGVTTLATFLCIRRYPKLISGNQSVIIVKPKETEESSPSRELEEPQYWEPSTIPSTQAYLTPKYHSHRYARIKYRPPLTRSISELIESNRTSIYGQPSQRRAPYIGRGRQNQRLERSERLEKIEIHAYQDYRPPLPSPNPRTSYGSSKLNSFSF